MNDELVHFGVLGQAEMRARVALREIAVFRRRLDILVQAAGDGLESRAESIAIAPCAHQFESQPVIARPGGGWYGMQQDAFAAQHHYKGVHVAVVVVIAKASASAHFLV